ncbi:hypothetical protein DYB34_013933 [Aphanomyces astaci]|uniref:Peptidase n=1 Tax=Aphanomyces astaci TaxID=112090 RepID=A0A418CBR2_APHAT|nr:hypothetical protein DYB34_013933 [Aphanomyces astaci]
MRIVEPVLATITAASWAKLHEPDKCTVILVGAKASASGSPMTTHTADCSSCDFRLTKVPQLSHPRGSLRNVPLLRQAFPRYGGWSTTCHIMFNHIVVGSDRGAPAYYLSNLEGGFYNWTETPIIGQIPQVATTYAYIDGLYPIINEHQLAIGESTCGANLWAKPATQGGKALFDITELARVAFERTKTAREAVQLMGDLAVQYGYYGAEWEGDAVYSEAGETLTVTDTKEGWVFHILPDDSGASAVWVAQRVPDTHIVAIGNQFIIHHVNLTDSDNFLGSSNLYDVAKRNNFWDGQSDFDFTVAYARRRPGESFYYSTRRQWRVYTLANPRLDLSPYTDAFGTTYPFSVETAGLLDASDLIRFQRDHYENTTFDLTQGPQSGPYGNPDRYCTANICALRFGPYAPHATSYVPIYAKVSSVPALTSKGSLLRFDFNASFWINALIGNYAGHFYKHAMPAVAAVQLAVEQNAFEGTPL